MAPYLREKAGRGRGDLLDIDAKLLNCGDGIDCGLIRQLVCEAGVIRRVMCNSSD
jgi:hypothetical protein